MTSAEMAAYLNARFTGGPAITNTELYMGFTIHQDLREFYE